MSSDRTCGSSGSRVNSNIRVCDFNALQIVSTIIFVITGVSVHVSNAAPKSEARRDGGYGREGRGSGGRENRVGRGDNGPDGPAGGMYQQRYNGPGSGAPIREDGAVKVGLEGT